MIMAEEKIFFDEQALSVVDSWLGGNNDKKSHKISVSSTGAPVSKTGLGFKGKVSEEKSKDALQVRLEKSQKKKRNSEVEDDLATKKIATDNNDDFDDEDDSGMQLHGIVEDMPISRTQRYSKPIVLTKTQPKKKPAVELINGNLVIEKKTEIIAVGEPSTSMVTKHLPNDVSTRPSGGDEFKRKRTKTRSKQKNIRRDNRPDSQKPSYITDTQAEDYRGRDLTEETRMRLGRSN